MGVRMSSCTVQNDDERNTFYVKVRQVIADLLNGRSTNDVTTVAVEESVTDVRRRRRRSDSVGQPASGTYTKDDVNLVGVEPVVKDEILRVVPYVQQQGGLWLTYMLLPGLWSTYN